MQANTALWHWREGRMSIEQVLSQADCGSFAELYEAAKDALENEAAAREMWSNSPEQEEEEELDREIWESYSDYLHEAGPPDVQLFLHARIKAAVREQQRQREANATTRFRGQ